MKMLLSWLSPTFMQNRFCTLPCAIVTFSLEKGNILKAVRTACIIIPRFSIFVLTISTVTASFHLSSEAASTSRI